MQRNISKEKLQQKPKMHIKKLMKYKINLKKTKKKKYI